MYYLTIRKLLHNLFLIQARNYLHASTHAATLRTLPLVIRKSETDTICFREQRTNAIIFALLPLT